ncbi:MAG TPA: glycosyltransferase [Chthoniobacterales bacterium]|nr:glycosyltransferase [Chthoniobacterales bacterium]
MKTARPISPAAEGDFSRDYLFHLDVLPEPRIFTNRLALTGWLLHRNSQPIHGLRAIVEPRGRRARTYKGRRKRERPAIGAAYPHLPEAATSGFLLEIEPLPLGPFTLRLEVRDHDKVWRKLFETEVTTFSLDFMRRSGFPTLERVLRTKLRERFSIAQPKLSLEPGEQAEIERGIADAGLPTAPVSAPVAVTTVHLFVTSKSNLFIREIGELVCAGFREAGITAELFVDRFPAEETPPDTIQIVVTPHEFYNLFLTPALHWSRIQLITRQLYLLGTEQPDSDWFHSNLAVAPYAHAMLDINSLGVIGYRARGLRCFHLPLGYHPILAATGVAPDVERKIDICLLASLTERREKFLAEQADFFAARNCHLRLVPLGFAKTETTKSYLPVERRNVILQESKILLNLHYSELRYFEWHRMLVGLANGCCIITEPCQGFAPLVPGKHFVMVETAELVRACEYYLQHAEEREAIARAGQQFVRQHLRQAQHCAAFLRELASGAPQSLGGNGAGEFGEASIGWVEERIGRRSTPRLLWEAFCEDLSNFSTPQPSDAGPPAEEETKSKEEEARTIATIEERRSGYAQRYAAQEKLRQAGGEAWTVSDNPPLTKGSDPAISIIITLYNYERYIAGCIRSVEEAETKTIPGGIEILIVNDASTDSSLARAEEAQRASALPVRLIAKQFNTGLADARNVGLHLARAPYVFIMDADNLIFPRALEELYAAIIRTSSAAAFSILARFRGPPDNRQGLLSYFDWDPRMLVEHPYIDAMALFDRRQLSALGGYDNDLYKVGWFGWEDYELWLRIAAAHLNATLVPNILCLYRHHESAMSNTTNLFEVDLVRHLIARYQPLIDEYEPKERVFGVEWNRLA